MLPWCFTGVFYALNFSQDVFTGSRGYASVEVKVEITPKKGEKGPFIKTIIEILLGKISIYLVTRLMYPRTKENLHQSTDPAHDDRQHIG